MADLRFGTFLAPNMLPVYQAIAALVGERLGATTEVIVDADYDNYRNDSYDVCFVCSLPYVVFDREGVSLAISIAAPVLEGERYGHRPIYFSDVIVHKSSAATSFMDLRGRSWCFNEPLSQSGYGITRYHLVSIGETDGFFSEVVETGFHETSIRHVAAGQIEASAIDSQVLAIEMRDHPEVTENIKVIDTLGPSTIQPMAVSKRIDTSTRNHIQSALLKLHTTKAGRDVLSVGGIERWAPVGPSDYDDIQHMVDACEAADFMEIR